MALKLSTGLVNKLLDTGSFKTLMAGCFIDIYSGVQPAGADSAATGTKLLTIYSDGTTTGLTWEASATDGVLEKNAAETWSCTSAAASGTAGWFRIREATDPGVLASATAVRVDGAVATSGGQMNLGSLTITAGAPFRLDAGSFTLPKAAV